MGIETTGVASAVTAFSTLLLAIWVLKPFLRIFNFMTSHIVTRYMGIETKIPLQVRSKLSPIVTRYMGIETSSFRIVTNPLATIVTRYMGIETIVIYTS